LFKFLFFRTKVLAPPWQLHYLEQLETVPLKNPANPKFSWKETTVIPRIRPHRFEYSNAAFLKIDLHVRKTQSEFVLRCSFKFEFTNYKDCTFVTYFSLNFTLSWQRLYYWYTFLLQSEPVLYTYVYECFPTEFKF